MVSEPTDRIALHGRTMSAVIDLVDGVPCWRHWGARVAGAAIPGIADTMPAASFSLDHRPAIAVVPTFGHGGFDAPALLAHRGGRDFAQGFDSCTVNWRAPGTAVALVLRDSVARLSVEHWLTINPASDVLTCSTRLTNDGDTPLSVDWLAAATLPLPADAATRRYTTGRHNGEFVSHEEPMGPSVWRRENRRGLTSHDSFPGAIVTMPGVTAQDGQAYGVQFAWSGNHVQSIAWSDEGSYLWQFGEWFAPGEMVLAPGETLTTPDMIATWSAAGLDGVANAFHAAVRARQHWPGGTMKPRPVHLNSWEGFYFDHDETRLKALADDAAAIGVERFVVDDGWFTGRNDDRAALGDWTTDAAKYPNGLGPLAAHVTGLGMEFGLWVEPEMVNPDSNLYRRHPDWALAIAGRPMLTARNQLVLDLSRAEVRDYLFDAMAALLNDLPIAYLKWDHNRDLTDAGGSDGRARYHDQVLGAYALFDRIRAAFPMVEIEACAGGGGRIDAGIAERTHRFWVSDNTDAVRRLPLQQNFLQFMPPELMGAHVAASPAHATGRRIAMDYRCAVAVPGSLGVELNPATLNDQDRATLMRWIAFYKHARGVLHGGGTWRGTAPDGMRWQAQGSPEHLYLFAYRTEPAQLRTPPSLRLAMLDGARQYRVRLAMPPHARNPAWFAAMVDTPALVDGDWLRTVGLAMPPMLVERAAVFELVAQ